MHIRVAMVGFLWALSGCGNAGSAFDGFYRGDVVSSSTGSGTVTDTGVVVQVASSDASSGIVLLSNHFSQGVFAAVSGSSFTIPVQTFTTQASGSGQLSFTEVTGGNGVLQGASLRFSVLTSDFFTVDGGAPEGALDSTLTFTGLRQ
jgi:hypothetical protein